MAPELLSTTYLTIFEKQQKGKCNVPVKDEDFVKWFSKCMSNYFKWTNSSFNKAQRLDIDEMERSEIREATRHIKKKGNEVYQSKAEDNFRGEIDGNPCGIEGVIDEDAQIDIELLVEETNDATREFIEISSSLGKNKTLKYLELIEFKRTLEAHESILFELYFEKEMSTRDIAKEYSMEFNIISYQSINKMVNVIKSKIRQYEWKQLNS